MVLVADSHCWEVELLPEGDLDVDGLFVALKTDEVGNDDVNEQRCGGQDDDGPDDSANRRRSEMCVRTADSCLPWQLLPGVCVFVKFEVMTTHVFPFVLEIIRFLVIIFTSPGGKHFPWDNCRWKSILHSC